MLFAATLPTSEQRRCPLFKRKRSPWFEMDPLYNLGSLATDNNDSVPSGHDRHSCHWTSEVEKDFESGMKCIRTGKRLRSVGRATIASSISLVSASANEAGVGIQCGRDTRRIYGRYIIYTVWLKSPLPGSRKLRRIEGIPV